MREFHIGLLHINWKSKRIVICDKIERDSAIT